MFYLFICSRIFHAIKHFLLDTAPVISVKLFIVVLVRGIENCLTFMLLTPIELKIHEQNEIFLIILHIMNTKFYVKFCRNFVKYS
jgi:hypothetical protein